MRKENIIGAYALVAAIKRVPVVAALIAIVILTAVIIAPTPAQAEDGSTVTVHVYDPAQKYSVMGGWFWINGLGGKAYPVSTEAAENEPFSKEFVQGGKQVKNSAYTFSLTFTKNETGLLKRGSKLGLLICIKSGNSGDFWKMYTKETPDILVDISKAFDSNNHANVYYVRKDVEAYTDLEEALKTLEKVTSAKFTSKSANNATVAVEVTTAIAADGKATLHSGGKAVATAAITPDASNPCAGTVTFDVAFDIAADYTITVSGFPNTCGVAKTLFIDDKIFIDTFENEDVRKLEFGALYTAQKTTFRVWAPFAGDVKIRLYAAGVGGVPLETLTMKRHLAASGAWDGVWEYELAGDKAGVYYTYLVNNDGVSSETIDPYAKACGIDGERGMIVNLAATDPIGWSEDKHLFEIDAVAADTPIVWELHVGDFSNSADSGMKYKGKYLAFTENNTTVPGQPALKTGVDYLKDLGITYVHLNPVYDFVTVAEGDMSKADNALDAFNWGYDPLNYNIPDGSYSTDPRNGNVRINEFKQMVMALHKAGIGVIMDVVYNHTYSTGGSPLHKTVPNYYHRTDASGGFTDLSGCGNDTSSERYMTRKYIIDSLKHWANEYHIDGFRFDLMGIHDLETIKQARAELDKIGKEIIMYGEPWTGEYGADVIPASFTNRINATGESSNSLIKKTALTNLPERVAVFNDEGRNGLRGDNAPGAGWAQGADGAGAVAALLNGTAKGLERASRNVAYATAHDNYTLWDQFVGKRAGTETPMYYDNPMEYAIKRCKLTSAAYLMSPGIAFILAGEEMGRTKYGNDNSYNSPAKLNQIVWSRQAAFAGLREHYKKLIAMRRKNSAELFSYKQAAESGSTGSWFGASGLTISGTRGALSLTLTSSDDGNAATGSVTIGSDSVKF